MSQGRPKLFCEKCRKTKPHMQCEGKDLFTHLPCGTERRWPRKEVPDTGIKPMKKEK